MNAATLVIETFENILASSDLSFGQTCSEVKVRGANGDLPSKLEDIVWQAIAVKPNFAFTLSELQEDVERVFKTGYFERCTPVPEDTRDGVALTIEVKPNSELKGVVIRGGDALPTNVVEEAFKTEFRETLNFRTFKDAVGKINSWYESRGLFGQVSTFLFRQASSVISSYDC